MSFSVHWRKKLATRLLPLRPVLDRTGRGKSSHYNAVNNGLMVPPVELGPRSRRYPEHEIEAINAAVVAGKPESEIRELVVSLVAARKGVT